MSSPGVRLRVLSVIPGTPEGASMIFARRQSQSVAAPDVEVAEFYLADRLSPIGVAREWARLRREIAQYSPHVVHAHYGTVTAVVAAAACGRRPLVVTYRGSDLNWTQAVSGWRSAMGRLLSQVASLRANRVICVSEGLRARLWWRRSSATILPSGVDTSKFRPRPRDDCRRALGLDVSGHLVVFNCGRDPWVKNLELAEASMSLVRSSLSQTDFIVMRGDWAPDQVPLLLGSADCLLVTSRREGSPNVVREALACGLPVVSVDVGDVRTWLEGMHECRLVRPDADEIADAILGVLKAGARVDAARLVESYSEASVADRLRAIYRSLAS